MNNLLTRRFAARLLPGLCALSAVIVLLQEGSNFNEALVVMTALALLAGNSVFHWTAIIACFGLFVKTIAVFIQSPEHANLISVGLQLTTVVILMKYRSHKSSDTSQPLTEILEQTVFDRSENDINRHNLPVSVVTQLRATGLFTEAQLSAVRAELESQIAQAESETAFSLQIGTSVGQYCLEAELGRGGSATVYSGRPLTGGDEVAIKLLKNSETTERFQREMDLVQHLAHPNVVVAYEVGEHCGLPFIVMEKLSGPNLEDYIKEHGPMPWRETIDVIVQAAHGLAHAHQRGLVHRDVKPGNLVRDGKNRIKITDLGLAALLEEEESLTEFHTLHGIVAGTPDYMAPEQAKALRNGEPVSDVYSLGATWHYLLTGKSRVPGNSLRAKLACLLSADQLFDVLPDNALPQQFRAIFNQMVAYDSADRIATMGEVIQRIQAVHADESRTRVESPAVNVLIIEDDIDDRDLTMELLKRTNKVVKAVTAGCLADGITASRSMGRVDMVLLDLRLPDSVGVDTVRRIKTELPNSPIVVLTGQNDLALGEACISAGAEEFACKNDLNAHLIERLIFITLSRFDRRRQSPS